MCYILPLLFFRDDNDLGKSVKVDMPLNKVNKTDALLYNICQRFIQARIIIRKIFSKSSLPLFLCQTCAMISKIPDEMNRIQLNFN